MLVIGTADVHVSPAYETQETCQAERERAMDVVAQEFRSMVARVKLAVSDCQMLRVMRVEAPKP